MPDDLRAQLAEQEAAAARTRAALAQGRLDILTRMLALFDGSVTGGLKADCEAARAELADDVDVAQALANVPMILAATRAQVAAGVARAQALIAAVPPEA